MEFRDINSLLVWGRATELQRKIILALASFINPRDLAEVQVSSPREDGRSASSLKKCKDWGEQVTEEIKLLKSHKLWSQVHHLEPQKEVCLKTMITDLTMTKAVLVKDDIVLKITIGIEEYAQGGVLISLKNSLKKETIDFLSDGTWFYYNPQTEEKFIYNLERKVNHPQAIYKDRVWFEEKINGMLSVFEIEPIF